jgi:hypothetical protein
MKAIICDSCGRIIQDHAEKHTYCRLEFHKTDGKLIHYEPHLKKDLCDVCASKIESMFPVNTLQEILKKHI